MKKFTTLCGMAIFAALPMLASPEAVLDVRFTPDKPILPSSQWTPNEPYEAEVWVFNEDQRYEDQYYNLIWATPAVDEEGKQWFEPNYVLTSEGGRDWSVEQAPFSSDEYYRDHLSYRWTTNDIMAEIYIRRSFTLDEVPAGDIFLACGHDDAPSEWYINGTLVFDVQDGWNNDQVYLLTDDQKALLVEGENLIAVHVHQNWGGAFADCGLYLADMNLVTDILPTVRSVEKWDCLYKFIPDMPENTDWAALDADTADWSEGFGSFSLDGHFEVTHWNSVDDNILVRREFDLTATVLGNAIADDTTMRLYCSYDENPVVYLNGEEIWSTGGWNDDNYAEYNLSAEQKALLKEGKNVLAVSLTKGAGGGHIDYGFSMIQPYDPIETGVEETVVAAPRNDNRIYNMWGQYMGTSVEGLSNGIYIIGGKKVVIRK